MTLLGETSNINALKASQDATDPQLGTLSIKASTWVKQNALTVEHLQQVFHLDDGNAQIIANDIPGNANTKKVVNCYVLVGLANLLATGESNFDDQSARNLCTTAGCYDQTNHAKAIKLFGNKITGSKEKGWALTVPGLKYGAEMVKEIAGSN